VKSTIAHATLLKEMLVQITKKCTDNKPALTFIPAGLVSTISGEVYVVLICKNNQYLTLAAMIPVVRFTAGTLNLEIDAYHLTANKSICNIILDMSWCHTMKPTSYVGKFLLVTTKAHLQEGRQWLDNNLLPMLQNYIKKHLAFIPDINHPIAQ